MATLDEIYDRIADEAAQEAALSALTPQNDTASQLRVDLSSGSRVAIWRLFAWIFAYASMVQQMVWERFRGEVKDLSLSGHFGTRAWYIRKAMEFQLGHVLQLTDDGGEYAVNDPTSRIVTHAVVTERANMVIVKVAKGNGPLEPLEPGELSALSDYFDHLRPTVQVRVLTAAADLLKVSGELVFDPETPIVAIQSAVYAAIGAYLQNLNFGGMMRMVDLRTAILGVQGVVDVVLADVQARSTGPYRPVGRTYTSYAGHMIMEGYMSFIMAMTWTRAQR